VRTAIVVVIAAALLVAACATTSDIEDLEQRIVELEQAATSTTTATTRDLNGTLTTTKPRVACIYKNNQIFEGNRITIRNGSDATLAFDTLSDKTVVEAPAGHTVDRCTFRFGFSDVPSTEGFYSIQLEGVAFWSFSQADLEELDWTVEIDTLG
jgi:predicted small secreted protein